MGGAVKEVELSLLLGTWRGQCCWSQSSSGFVGPRLDHVSPGQRQLLRWWEAEKVIYASMALERGGAVSWFEVKQTHFLFSNFAFQLSLL